MKPDVVVLNRIAAKKAGMDLPTNQLEAHLLAGGNVSRVVRAMIAAGKAQINLSWENATAIDLAGRDILTAVQTSVDPRVIDCPSQEAGKPTIAAVAQDGIQLRTKARVTVRTNIARLVGGATEETIIARVGEGIVSAIGSATTHKVVLENPDNISKTVLSKVLIRERHSRSSPSTSPTSTWARTSVRSSRQTRPAPTPSATRRKPSSEEPSQWHRKPNTRPKPRKTALWLFLPKPDVPKAIADSFRSGHLGIMDYYRMQNVMSDTEMRNSIAEADDES